MKTKFTKGPWKAEECGPSITVWHENTRVCDVGHRWDDNDKANAHLIAAAPEMYDELQSFIDDGDLQSFAQDRIERLLAKARGEAL